MREDFVTFFQNPRLRAPILIAGFGDWSNAGNVALKSIDYIIKKKGATLMAEISPDPFYQFTQKRPVVTIKEGRLQGLSLKKISFYFLKNREGKEDIILLKAQEPDYRWLTFIQTIVHLCKKWGVSFIVSLGGMFDDVLHTDAIVSGVCSLEEWRKIFVKKDIPLIEYEGPSGIHSLIMQWAEKENYPFIGLWGHSPLYLRGTNFRVVVKLVKIISSFFSFSINTVELECSQGIFEHQIEEILENNTELQEYIESLKRTRKGQPLKKDAPKIIYIKDFIRQRDL
ncbi:MAG TPA: PAC2 family protein [Desulfatiglandales bacterium]|nr:PAC2 family protein [Desulfatiglandales bacterium]